MNFFFSLSLSYPFPLTVFSLSLCRNQVLVTYVSKLSRLVPQHSVPITQTNESLRALLFQASDPSPEVRTMAFNYLNELFSSFPSLVCEKEVVTVMLELLTVLRRSCLSEFLDEVSKIVSLFRSSITLPTPRLSKKKKNSTHLPTPFRLVTSLSLYQTITLSDNVSCEIFTTTFEFG